MLVLTNQFLVIPVENLNSIPLSDVKANINLDTTTAAKNEVKIPIINVVANPLIGPEPNDNTIPIKSVVILASKIAAIALLNPSSSAALYPFPDLNSSLILSKISTFASTDIPIVNTIPAIPGKVKIAPIDDNAPTNKKILTTNATSAIIPAFP